ncbi:hypothetical protein AMJ57_03285 [Parcubacteria bacterium SG8_24]|nr:MAG: hypothetical protein AMJ57_03285 [Parcubacteria bacterium SG8_24]
MPENGNNRNDGPCRKGGLKSAVLLWSGLALLAGITFLVTCLWLAPRDSLLGHVPDDVGLYVHVETGQTGLDRTFLLPPGLPDDGTPDELAVFVRPTGDGGLDQGTLLRWKGGVEPGSRPARFLLENGAIPLSHETYLLGDDRTREEAWTAVLAGRSLDADESVVRALAAMRRLSLVQIYVDPVSLSADGGLPFRSEAFGDLQPLVMALNAGPGRISGPILSVSRAADLPRLVGPRLPSPDRLPQPYTGLIDHEADLTYLGMETLFDPVSVLLGAHQQRWQTIEDGIRNTYLETTNRELRKMLDGPVVLNIYAQDEGGGRPVGAVAQFPEVRAESLKTVLNDYLNASSPAKKKLILPDGSVATELRIEDDYEPLVPEDRTGLDQAYSARSRLGVDSPVLARTSEGVTLVANNDLALTSFLSNAAGADEFRSDQTCADRGGFNRLDIRNLSLFDTYSPELSLIPLWESFSRLRIEEIGDNFFWFCGYSSAPVDN